MLTFLLALALGPLASEPDAIDQSAGKELDRLIQEGQKAIDGGDLPHAFELFDAAKKIAPNDARVPFWVGKAYLWQAQTAIAANQTGAELDSALEDAETSLRKAVDMDPGSPDIAAMLGRCLLLRGREVDAADKLDTAATLGAHTPEFFLDLGDAHFGVYTAQKEAAEGDLGVAELAKAGQAYEKGKAQILASNLAKLTADQLTGGTTFGATIEKQCLD